MTKRDTVGKLSTELLTKAPDSRDPIELERGLHTDFEKDMLLAIERGKKRFNGPFYVVVLTKKEKLMENVLREYFIDRESCPSPEYDQAVYKIHQNPEAVEFLWVIPSKPTCQYLKFHSLEVVEDERWLLEYVLAFYDHRLYTWALQLNNEICSKENTCQKCKHQNPQILKTSSTNQVQKNKNQLIIA